MRIPLNEYLYAIVKSNDGFLELKTIRLELDSEPTKDELAEHHSYSMCLGEQYCSDLPFIPYQNRNTGYGITNIADRRIAIAFAQTTKRIKSEYDVVAVSHRLGGWKSFEWQYNDDITFRIHSNFGYGSASYLMSQFFYKGLQLTPYSQYIRYRYSNYSDLMRYTYDYALSYDEWRSLMLDTLDFYNAVCNQKEHKVFTWIENHLRTMVDGLTRLMNSNNTFTFYRRDGQIADEVNGDELICVKADKISGAVDFIKNICNLPVQVNPDFYIQKLEGIFTKFTSYANSKMAELAVNISSLERQIDELNHSSLLSMYDRLRSRNYYKQEWYMDSNKKKMFRYLLEIRNRLGIEKESVRPALKELDELLKTRENLKSQLSHANHIFTVLSDAVKKIDKHISEQAIENVA